MGCATVRLVSLRKLGCTEREIAAITGHKSLTMIQKYSKGASQKRLAITAIGKREHNKKHKQVPKASVTKEECTT